MVDNLRKFTGRGEPKNSHNNKVSIWAKLGVKTGNIHDSIYVSTYFESKVTEFYKIRSTGFLSFVVSSVSPSTIVHIGIPEVQGKSWDPVAHLPDVIKVGSTTIVPLTTR